MLPIKQPEQRMFLPNVSKPIKFLLLLCTTAAIAVFAYLRGFSAFESLIIMIFCTSILGSLFFWDFKLGIMFVGSALYLLIGAVNAEDFVRFASLDVILFLICMMIIVGMMKDVGLFEWLILILFRMKNMTGRKMFVILMATSALFSSLMGEVASIMILTASILEICDILEIDPVPLVICSVIATNIGSAATILGNPVGILIAARSGLSFEDFLVHALPNSMLNLLIVLGCMVFLYRRYIGQLSLKLNDYTHNAGFISLIAIPSERKTKVSIFIFCATILLIALHKRLEILFGLPHNTLLLMFPILSAGIIMLYQHQRARHYIEKEIEWPSILFFMFLFAQAGVIQASGIAQTIATRIISVIQDPEQLIAIVLFSSGALSSVLDNVVTVATYIPIINELESMRSQSQNLWWALLFGACYGGNITMIGSTANIVALGMLEKEANIEITFERWLKIGLLVGVLNLIVTYALLSMHNLLFF